MPSSELSDALNPNVAQIRRYEDLNYAAPQHYEHSVGNSYGSSELELAVVEPAVPPRPKNVHPVHELLRILATSKEAEQAERQRRLAWEHEQEIKTAQRQAEMERRFQDMQQEISGLKAYISLTQPTMQTPQAPHMPQDQTGYHRSFVQGSSSMPLDGPSMHTEDNTPPLSSGSSSNELSAKRRSTRLRKRSSPPASTASASQSSDDEGGVSNPLHAKRLNGHDSRCLTIQRAMKAHIYLLMEIDEEDDLPEDYIEGAPVNQGDPIRFIWKRTVKQSPHNANMKAQVLADLVQKRQLYELVPSKDFDPKSLDGVFEQTFNTLRRNFKAQSDPKNAAKRRKQEVTKFVKSRRASRKRAKLGVRTGSRQQMEEFSHPTFDGALHLDCMSSEESDQEQSSEGLSLHVRPLPWRSTRLVRFYQTLDEEHLSTNKPKGGAGKKEKVMGPMKEGYLILPPKGVSYWMVSKRWLRSMRAVHKDLEDWLKPLLVDPPGFDWGACTELGEETDDEYAAEEQVYSPVIQHSMGTSSSLQYALQL